MEINAVFSSGVAVAQISSVCEQISAGPGLGECVGCAAKGRGGTSHGQWDCHGLVAVLGCSISEGDG